MERIILLPGYDGDGEKTFGKLKKLLEKKAEVLTVDYPYLNNWEKQYSLVELIDYINAVIKDKKVVLLGFSMGGFVASAYATKYPEKVSRLILVSSATSPKLDNKLKIILMVAKVMLLNKLTADWLTKLFLASNLKNFPLPHPGENFKPEQGFGVFGSLVKVMSEKWDQTQPTLTGPPSSLGATSSTLDREGYKKEVILFEDDNSFPAKVYGPILKNQGFEVKIFETGGHAERRDYWEKVASVL
ncbi:alpha/beta hydrolase [Candidatus Shapirobacteria bacterium]|nr:alpha/beta hydrolase [Candidatus Shapirobacteria bacterium]